MFKRLFIAAIIFGVTFYGCSDGAVETSATLGGAAMVSLLYLGFHAWRYGCKKTDERVAQERATRGSRPGFFARLARNFGSSGSLPDGVMRCRQCRDGTQSYQGKNGFGHTVTLSKPCPYCNGTGWLKDGRPHRL